MAESAYKVEYVVNGIRRPQKFCKDCQCLLEHWEHVHGTCEECTRVAKLQILTELNLVSCRSQTNTDLIAIETDTNKEFKDITEKAIEDLKKTVVELTKGTHATRKLDAVRMELLQKFEELIKTMYRKDEQARRKLDRIKADLEGQLAAEKMARQEDAKMFAFEFELVKEKIQEFQDIAQDIEKQTKEKKVVHNSKIEQLPQNVHDHHKTSTQQEEQVNEQVVDVVSSDSDIKVVNKPEPQKIFSEDDKAIVAECEQLSMMSLECPSKNKNDVSHLKNETTDCLKDLKDSESDEMMAQWHKMSLQLESSKQMLAILIGQNYFAPVEKPPTKISN